jgi:hypothetical protein
MPMTFCRVDETRSRPPIRRRRRSSESRAQYLRQEVGIVQSEICAEVAVGVTEVLSSLCCSRCEFLL